MRNACSVLVVGLAMFSLADCASTGRNAGLGRLGGEVAGRYKCHLKKIKVEQDFKDVKIGGKKVRILIDQIKPDFFLQLGMNSRPFCPSRLV